MFYTTKSEQELVGQARSLLARPRLDCSEFERILNALPEHYQPYLVHKLRDRGHGKIDRVYLSHQPLDLDRFYHVRRLDHDAIARSALYINIMQRWGDLMLVEQVHQTSIEAIFDVCWACNEALKQALPESFLKSMIMDTAGQYDRLWFWPKQTTYVEVVIIPHRLLPDGDPGHRESYGRRANKEEKAAIGLIMRLATLEDVLEARTYDALLKWTRHQTQTDTMALVAHFLSDTK